MMTVVDSTVIDLAQRRSRLSHITPMALGRADAAAMRAAALRAELAADLSKVVAALEVNLGRLRGAASKFRHAGFDAARFEKASAEIEALIQLARAKITEI